MLKKKITQRFTGQATIELLIILSILFVILGISIHLFSQQRVSANEQEERNGAQRNAQLLGNAIMHLSAAPIGSSLRIFVPPSSSSQMIWIRNGFVEVQSGNTLVLVGIPNRSVSVGPFSDGTTLLFSRNMYSITVAPPA